jgi:hypothetical protein
MGVTSATEFLPASAVGRAVSPGERSIEQIGLVGDDLVVERLEAEPTGDV